jgi:asparagine synthase (glutamine-hydrolysing)
MYEEYGLNCLEQLRGMFAFAVWDTRTCSLVIARDHLGQKPLFYAEVKNDFVFASEPKALTSAFPELRQLDLESMSHYLSLRFVPSPSSMLRDIKKLPPASYLVRAQGTVRKSRYWTPSFATKLELSDAAFIDGLEEKFRETVSSHLVGDVPIGAFLSGGLDSSLIVAAMASAKADKIATFSVGTQDSAFDETPYARLVSDRYGTRQLEVKAETNFINSIVPIIWHLDEPSDPVAASKFLASRLAASHVKVALGGDGGDELFAGFDRYRGIQSIAPYARFPSFVREKVVGRLANSIPASFGYDSFSQKLRWANRVASVNGVAQRFAEATFFFRFCRPDKRQLFTSSAWNEIGGADTSSLIEATFNASDAKQPIERMLYTDYVMRLPEHSLMLTDRLSMANGLEVRSPLVDKELVDYLGAFPLRMKIRRGKTKYAERELAKRWLPLAIAQRAKRGFRFPLARWFGNELYSFLNNVFQDSQLVQDEIFRLPYIETLLNEHRCQVIDHHVRLWMLLNMEIWYRLVILDTDQDELSQRLGLYLSDSQD